MTAPRGHAHDGRGRTPRLVSARLGAGLGGVTSPAGRGAEEREAGPLARLARDASCGVCGDLLREPLLLPCEHCCCRRCLPQPAGGGPGTTAHPPACPLCRRPCPPHRLRTPVALAVETRIVRRLAGEGKGETLPPTGSGTPSPPGNGPTARRRRRGGGLGAQLRADAASTPPKNTPHHPWRPPGWGGSPPKTAPPLTDPPPPPINVVTPPPQNLSQVPLLLSFFWGGDPQNAPPPLKHWGEGREEGFCGVGVDFWRGGEDQAVIVLGGLRQ